MNDLAVDVKNNIVLIYKRKVFASISLCKYYSAKSQEIFRKNQIGNEYWTNRTGTALNEVFGGVIEAQGEAGFFLAHKVEYGIYLELANDRKHESLWPVVRDLDSEFQTQLRKIWE